MKRTLKITGLDCAGCAAELEEELAKIEGVTNVSVSFVNQKITVEHETAAALSKVIEYANGFEEVKVLDDLPLGATVLHLENLDCPVCAEALQCDLQKIKGVNSVSVDYVSQTIILDAESEEAVAKVVKKANSFEEVRVLDGGRYETKSKSHLRAWIMIGISTLFFIAGILFEHLGTGTVATVFRYLCFAIAYIAVGYPVLISTAKNISKGRVFDENFLMTVASLGAIAIGEVSESVLVMLLYQIGELLQSIAVGSSRNSVTELMKLKSESATLLVNGEQKTVRPEEVQVGDILLIKTGEKVPVDGILLGESATLDTKSLTGEAELRTFKKGEEILSGCINAGGMYEMKAIRLYQESAVSKILDMVENASAGKAAPEKFITKFARIYTPVVCISALVIAVCAPLLNGLVVDGSLYFKDWMRWLQSALTFLVISCPCALIISVPLTYFSGIGTCAKKGILVKGATYLDTVAKVQTVAFDKTGTLTEGNFVVCGVHSAKGSEDELLALIAAVERGSSHPIAKAFAAVATDYVAESVTEEAGRGLRAIVNGEPVLVGNEKLLREAGVEFVATESVYTVVYLAKNGEYMGYAEIGDRIRSEAKSAVEDLKKLGVNHLVMLTGDGEKRAQKIANEVGMYEVNAQLLPVDKLKKAEELKRDGVLMYVGDGINDAPVMVAADCAVSMGKLGSAAAVEASDLVLVSDDLSALPKTVKIAKKTRAIVLQNIVFSIVMKVGFMVLGVLGVLPLWLAVFADVGVMLLAVLNSFRVRFTRI